MGPLIASLLLSSAAVAPSLTIADMKTLPPAKLASKLLSPDQAGRIVGGSVGRVWLPGQVYVATFWDEAVPVDDLICKRREYRVEAANPTATSSPDDPNVVLEPKESRSVEAYALSFPKGASRARCRDAKGYTRPTAEQRQHTLSALRQLAVLMRAAAGTGSLPFDLSCRQERSIAEETADRDRGVNSGWRSCGNDRAAFTNLPVDALFGVQLKCDSYVADQVRPSKSGAPARIIRCRLPAPASPPKTTEYLFGPSGPDGKSWQVSIGHTGGRAKVEMTRTTVIYH